MKCCRGTPSATDSSGLSQAGRGRRPIPAETMLRIYFMQQWYGLSDPAMEDSLYEVASMRRFAEVALDAIPDETTICKFRHFLERYRLTEILFENVHQSVFVGTGFDPPRKHHCGCHYSGGTDFDQEPGSSPGSADGFYQETSASVYDLQMMDECLHGDEEVIYGDKAYVDAQRHQEARAEGIEWCVLRKATRGRKLTYADRSFNRKSKHASPGRTSLWHHQAPMGL